MVLLDGLEGEEQEQQQHGETEDRSTPTAHQGTKTTEAVSHQDTVAHAERERERGWGGDKYHDASCVSQTVSHPAATMVKSTGQLSTCG